MATTSYLRHGGEMDKRRDRSCGSPGAHAYNMAQIRALQTDDPAELPGGPSDVNNIRLANIGGASPSNQFGIPTSFPAGLPVLGAGSGMYRATGIQ